MRNELLVAMAPCESIQFLDSPSRYPEISFEIRPSHTQRDLRRNRHRKLNSRLRNAWAIETLPLQIGIEQGYRGVGRDKPSGASISAKKGEAHLFQYFRDLRQDADDS